MRKIFYFIIIIAIILSVFSTVNAKTSDILDVETSDSVISLSSNIVELNKEFYLILNLSKIPYSKFKVEITNTSSLQAEEITSDVTDLSKNNVATSFIVDKDSITLDKLGIVYKSPNQNSKIKFSVKITSLDESIENLNQKLNTLQTEINNLQNNLTLLKDSLTAIEDIESEEYKNSIKEIEEITLNIDSKTKEKNELTDKITNFKKETISEETTINVEEKVLDENEDSTKKNPWNDKDSILDDMMKDKEKEMNTSMRKMMDQMSDLELDLKNANSKISSLSQSVTYQGSQNNYLSSLNISGIELKNSFKKTTTTYFANIDSEVTKVTVNAIPEDSSSIVTVYGNTDLQQGQNKIIISVTANDGSVRTYKIYVTK